MQSQHYTEAKEQRCTWRRQAALALVLALLAVLVIVATASAYVARRTETTLGDFDSGTFSYTGLLDLPDENIDSVQLMPVGLAGDWQTANQTLLERLANLGAAVSGNRIYVVGGTDNSQNARSEVYSYGVGADGALSPPQAQSALPEGIAAAGVTVYDPDGPSPVLYAVGGFDADFYAKNTIYRAPINSTSGDVGTWIQDSQVLPSPVESPAVAVHQDTLYIIGGWDSKSYPDVVLDKVYRAPIGASGALGELVETSPLPEPLYGGVAIVYDGEAIDTLYFIGGRNSITSTYKVYFADILENGELTSWTLSEGNLPVHLYGHGGVYLRGQIILTGGYANAINLSDGISSTVKAALVDPTNTTFRLYDWCQDAPPDCTIGAWQTGALLPEVRALHEAVAVGDYLYVVGGQDGDGDARDTIYCGTVDGAGAVYAPEGKYLSDEIYLGQEAKLLELEWDTTISRPDEMGLTMQYRYSFDGLDWVDWTAPVQSVNGSKLIEVTGQPEGVRYFQYQASLSTTVATASPLLNWVDLYYEVPDPDLEVIKDTGSVVNAALGTPLTYTITYRNIGGWRAEDAELTETLPENTTFDGSPGWQQVGTSNQYTYQVGDVPRDGEGTVTFRVRVNDDVPPNTEHITNVVEIDYPPMLDAWDNWITDPNMDDNEYEFNNPLSILRAVDLAITDLVWEPAATVAGMWPTFCLTVTNIGNADLDAPPEGEVGFWVELYIKPSPSEPPEWPSDHDWGYCLDGCTITRTQYVRDFNQALLVGEEAGGLCFEPQVPGDPTALDFPVAGTYDVYAQVDVAFEGDSLYWGRYSEGNEDNNVVQDSMVVFDADYRVYLPLILRSAP
jgi:uncharacterized repeat protein (TIGR01451 family)